MVGLAAGAGVPSGLAVGEAGGFELLQGAPGLSGGRSAGVDRRGEAGTADAAGVVAKYEQDVIAEHCHAGHDAPAGAHAGTA